MPTQKTLHDFAYSSDETLFLVRGLPTRLSYMTAKSLYEGFDSMGEIAFIVHSYEYFLGTTGLVYRPLELEEAEEYAIRSAEKWVERGTPGFMVVHGDFTNLTSVQRVKDLALSANMKFHVIECLEKGDLIDGVEEYVVKAQLSQFERYNPTENM